MKSILYILIITSIISIFFMACKDDDDIPALTNIQVRLTDAPGTYNQVNIDLQQVRVKPENSDWIDVSTIAGMYDLIKLTNGLDTLIVSDSLPAGQQLQQIRLILGDSSTIMVDSVLHPLETPSAEESGLKINLNKVLIEDSLNTVILDFDAQQSIVEKGNGTYSLKPVIKVVN